MSSRSESPSRIRRGVVVGTVVAALLALGFADSRHPQDKPRTLATLRADQAQIDTGIPNQTWFCPGGPLGANGSTSVELSNVGDEPVEVAVNGLGDAAALAAGMPVPAGRVVQIVPAYSVVSVPLSEVVSANYAGAVVESSGSSIVASTHVLIDGGYGATPCVRDTSSTWYVADGSTIRGARLIYLVLNPFPGDSVVDITFFTSAGRREPDETQALLVPGRSVAVVEVDKAVLRADHVAAETHVRQGRVVLGWMSHFTAESGRSGTVAAVGTPRPAGSWYFAHGLFGDGKAQRVALFNPNDKEADVLVATPVDGDVADPFEQKVPAHGYSLLTFEGQDRVTAGTEHSIVVESVNGVSVVAQRIVDGTGGNAIGQAVGLGVSGPAREWVIPAVERASASTTVWVANFGTSAAVLTVEVLRDGQVERPAEIQAIQLPPGERKALAIPADGGEGFAAVVVKADHEVVVQADRVAQGGTGMGTVAGIPVRVLAAED